LGQIVLGAPAEEIHITYEKHLGTATALEKGTESKGTIHELQGMHRFMHAGHTALETPEGASTNRRSIPSWLDFR